MYTAEAKLSAAQRLILSDFAGPQPRLLTTEWGTVREHTIFEYEPKMGRFTYQTKNESKGVTFDALERNHYLTKVDDDLAKVLIRSHHRHPHVWALTRKGMETLRHLEMGSDRIPPPTRNERWIADPTVGTPGEIDEARAVLAAAEQRSQSATEAVTRAQDTLAYTIKDPDQPYRSGLLDYPGIWFATRLMPMHEERIATTARDQMESWLAAREASRQAEADLVQAQRDFIDLFPWLA